MLLCEYACVGLLFTVLPLYVLSCAASLAQHRMMTASRVFYEATQIRSCLQTKLNLVDTG